MKKRLSKTLAAAGVASRRTSEEWIFSGRVKVNGKTTLLPQTLVDLAVDRVEVDGKTVQSSEEKVYFLLHKPAGLISTNVEKKGGAKRVLDLFSHLPYRLFTVGRLDQATTGLMLVTNDGVFANRVIHPSFHHTKEYVAKTDQEITFEHLQALASGVRIGGKLVQPVAVKKVRRGTVKITIAEGKKHEIRRFLENAHLTVRELCRIRLGPLTLGPLEPGAYRPLTEEEIAHFNC